jgi:hypothetical protein
MRTSSCALIVDVSAIVVLLHRRTVEGTTILRRGGRLRSQRLRRLRLLHHAMGHYRPGTTCRHNMRL